MKGDLFMKELNEHIKNKKFTRSYLFFGEETYLLGHWRKILISGILPGIERQMNMEVFEGKVEVQKIIDAAETLPFMADYRLVVVIDSGLFNSGRNEDSSVMAEYAANIPQSSVLLFIEKDIDKRGKLYKRLAKEATVLEAKTPKESELMTWAAKIAASRGCTISKQALAFLVRTISADMGLLYNEIEKLCIFKGPKAEISVTDIETICTKSIEAKIFDLMKAIGNKDAKRASLLYANLLAAKESPLMVLTMIARQFRYYLLCSNLAPSMSQKDIAAKLALHPFAVREFVESCRNFSQDFMLRSLENCLETDFAIKSGKIGDSLGVEILIAQCCVQY